MAVDLAVFAVLDGYSAVFWCLFGCCFMGLKCIFYRFPSNDFLEPNPRYIRLSKNNLVPRSANTLRNSSFSLRYKAINAFFCFSTPRGTIITKTKPLPYLCITVHQILLQLLLISFCAFICFCEILATAGTKLMPLR